MNTVWFCWSLKDRRSCRLALTLAVTTAVSQRKMTGSPPRKRPKRENDFLINPVEGSFQKVPKVFNEGRHRAAPGSGDDDNNDDVGRTEIASLISLLSYIVKAGRYEYCTSHCLSCHFRWCKVLKYNSQQLLCCTKILNIQYLASDSQAYW